MSLRGGERLADGGATQKREEQETEKPDPVTSSDPQRVTRVRGPLHVWLFQLNWLLRSLSSLGQTERVFQSSMNLADAKRWKTKVSPRGQSSEQTRSLGPWGLLRSHTPPHTHLSSGLLPEKRLSERSHRFLVSVTLSQANPRKSSRKQPISTRSCRYLVAMETTPTHRCQST